MKPILSVSQLTKRFPVRGSPDVVHAVNQVSFTVHEGEVLGLVGESGSGKTTVGRCVLRLVEPDSGTIVFDGQDVTRLSKGQYRPLRSQMQMVFQDPYESLNPRMTIGQSIEEALLVFTKQSAAERRERVSHVLEMVRIEPALRSAFPHQLSGGQQQRVGIARAIVMNPKLLILDEPTSALDISVRAEIVELLYDLKERLRLSYVFISHDLTAVRYISDRIAVMYLGQIVEMGKTEEIFASQYMPYSRALLSSVLYPDINQVRSSFVLKGEIPSPIHLPRGCFLASRCPLVRPQCHQPVELAEVVPDRHARCIRIQQEGLAAYDSAEAEPVLAGANGTGQA